MPEERYDHTEEAEGCMSRAAMADDKGHHADAEFWHREGIIHAVLALADAIRGNGPRTFVRHKPRSSN